MTNEELVREITEVSQREKSNSHRIDEIENDIKDLQEKIKYFYNILQIFTLYSIIKKAGN